MEKKKRRPTLGELLFPSKCIICQKVLPLDQHICPECARLLPLVTSSTPVHGDFFDGCYAPFYYKEPLRASFLRYKFNGFSHYASLYGKWMADFLLRENLTQWELVTWAPISRLRRWKRSYDQAELLAKEIGKLLELPVLPTLKKAQRKALSRAGNEKALRAAIVLGAYSLLPNTEVAGKRILLVDDVVTTGSTLSECARILKTAGAAQVTCITLARKK